jgi:hypothetical protein
MLPGLMRCIPESLKQPPQTGGCAIKIGYPELNVMELPIRHGFSLADLIADVSLIAGSVRAIRGPGGPSACNC